MGVYNESCIYLAQSDMEGFTNNLSEFLSDPYLHPSVHVKQQGAAELRKRTTDKERKNSNMTGEKIGFVFDSCQEDTEQ